MATAENSWQASPQVSDPLHEALRHQLEYRRDVLSSAVERGADPQLGRLLREVDSALDRLHAGTYGICEQCHEAVEDQQLLADPMVRFCLDHLAPAEQAALQRDLELASQIQARLLPPRVLQADGWSVAYHYRPVGVVSGDYCDVVTSAGGEMYFMLGDVSGKGVAASMLMSNLSAIFRTLIPLGLPLTQLMERANRVFTGSTLPTQFATLVCGRALPGGGLELCNAGHLPALLVGRDRVQRVESHALPLGLFAEPPFTTSHFDIAPGESVVLFSDGISEAQSGEAEFGEARIAEAIRKCAALAPQELVDACVRELVAFLGSSPAYDDQTLMVVQKASAGLA
jgi:sigma-B regulation protein RsbU (phosphoserine phosphatase)